MFQRAGLLSGTKEPGAMLSRVQVPGVARNFCPRVNFQRRLCDGVCTVTCISICISDISMCVHTKMSTLVATPLFGRIKILHVLVGMDNILLKKDEEEGESGFGSGTSLVKKPFTFYFSHFLCMVCS